MDLVFTRTMIRFLRDIVPVFDFLSLSTAFTIDFTVLYITIYVHRRAATPSY